MGRNSLQYYLVDEEKDNYFETAPNARDTIPSSNKKIEVVQKQTKASEETRGWFTLKVAEQKKGHHTHAPK